MLKKIQPYLLNVSLITFIFILLCFIFSFVPFGENTFLTIDLGQQYIDFFSQFKDTVLHHPTKFFYSFEKGFGGEMIGLWAYYLMSPFNLVFLFFNESNFDTAITLISYLKIVAASLTFMWFCRRVYQLDTIHSLLFSLAYSLMSYTFVYLLNIMWLDGLVFLPVIAIGLNQVIYKRRFLLYVLSLALMLISNYYIGYMICLFLAMYAIFIVVEQQSSNDYFDFKQAIFNYGAFVRYSIYACLIACIMLIPTLQSLLLGKGTHQSLEWTLETTHHFFEIFSKSFIGSFEYDEISSGSPNIFASILVVYLVLAYFFNKKFPMREKGTVLLIGFLFYLSFRYDFLIKLWHGGQFPIWYDFRFSFTFTFFLLVIAMRSYSYLETRPPVWKPIGILLLMSGFVFYYLYQLEDYPFLDEYRLILSLIVFIGYLFLLSPRFNKLSMLKGVLLLIVTIEMTTNAGLILGQFNYVNQNKFRDYTHLLNQAVTPIRHDDTTFYRTNKTYMRTKNEAMYAHYHGLDHFGSTIEAHVPELYGYMGLPSGKGFIAYTNGTLFSDDFFNMRYLLDITPDTREQTADDEYVIYRESADLDRLAYPLVYTSERYLLRENDQLLGLGMEMTPAVRDSQELLVHNDPIGNQEKLLSLLDFSGNTAPFYQQHNFDNVTYHDVEVTDTGDGDYYTYVNHGTEDEPGYVELTFSTSSTNPYYFTMPSQLSKDKVSLTLNDKRYRFYTPYRYRQITNASYDTISDEQTFRFYLKEDKLIANLFHLYEFDEVRYHTLIEEKSPHLFEVNYFNHNEIHGQITTQLEDSQLVFTIPYDDNWQVTIDGENVDTQPVLNDTLLSVPLTGGTHQVRLYYFPRGIYYGLFLMIIGITTCIIDYLWLKSKSKKLR